MAITIRTVAGTEAMALVPALADILAGCVNAGASVGFWKPMSAERAHAFWQEVMAALEPQRRVLLVAEQAGRVVGTVQVVPAPQQNQPHRGDITKMLVHPAAQGQGIGLQLLTAAETAACAIGLSLLILDTGAGTAGERLYTKGGWTRLGTIPRYALHDDLSAVDSVFFYKAL